MTRSGETAGAALSLAISGLVALAIAFGGAATYEAIARGFAPATFRFGSGATERVESVALPALVRYHKAWFGYVTGDVAEPPVSFGRQVFTAQEYAHMADVRRVFVGARIAAGTAAAAAAFFVIRAWRRERRAAARLVRNASALAGAAVLIVAVAAALAFEPLFLLFHRVFFPQGNFLFGPDSNLLALYPDQYWYGVTLLTGGAFVAACFLLAGAAHATSRVGRR